MKRLGKFFNSKWGGIVALITAISCFLALTLTRITTSSIWFDEAFSAYITKYNLAEITHYTALDVHPPLYYWLLKGWTSIFGTSAFAFRSMSIFFGVVTLILLFFLVKRLFNRKTAAASVFLVAISPLFVRFGIEARMYTLVTAIVLAATLMLWRSLRTNKLRDYIIYGVLVCLGMLTHYFTAVVWLSHWLYRIIYLRTNSLSGRKLAKAYFSKEWIIAHIVAIGLYLPWIPTVISQLHTVSSGFWIPAVTANTPSDYLSEFLFYLQGSQTSGWLPVLFFITVTLLGILIYRYLHQIRYSRAERRSFYLILTMAIAPVIFLMLLSLPPLTSSFVDRYVLSAAIFTSALIAVLIVNYKASKANWWITPTALTLAVICCFGYGIFQVYHQGNYNKFNGSSVMTGEVIRAIQQADHNNTPIISNSPYGYYEASFYDSTEHPTYFLWDSVKNDSTGSLAMLRDNHFNRAVKNISRFANGHHQIWVTGTTNTDTIYAPTELNTSAWKAVRTITISDPVTGSDQYKATLYDIK